LLPAFYYAECHVLASPAHDANQALMIAILIVTAGGSTHAQTTDFFDLVKTGTPQTIQTAINKGADVNAQDSDDWTPLMDAATYNPDPKVIATLLKAGGDAKV
jgi:ankyrin repeat protein